MQVGVKVDVEKGLETLLRRSPFRLQSTHAAPQIYINQLEMVRELSDVLRSHVRISDQFLRANGMDFEAQCQIIGKLVSLCCTNIIVSTWMETSRAPDVCHINWLCNETQFCQFVPSMETLFSRQSQIH